MKGLIYSAILGDRDRPLPRRVKEKNVDYVMFTDAKAPKGWDRIDVDPSPDPRAAARLLKIKLPEIAADYDWAMWIDGSHVPVVPMGSRVSRWLEKKDFAAFAHPRHNCVYDEIALCKARKKDDPDKLDRLEKKIVYNGVPKNFGMIATTVLARRVKSTRTVCHSIRWVEWLEVSVRDQPGFMAAMWILRLDPDKNIHKIFGDVFKNNLFYFNIGHRRRRDKV